MKEGRIHGNRLPRCLKLKIETGLILRKLEEAHIQRIERDRLYKWKGSAIHSRELISTPSPVVDYLLKFPRVITCFTGFCERDGNKILRNPKSKSRARGNDLPLERLILVRSGRQVETVESSSNKWGSERGARVEACVAVFCYHVPAYVANELKPS